MVYSGFGSEPTGAQPNPPMGGYPPMPQYPQAPLPPLSQPEPAERPFLLSDDVDTPAFPQAFEDAFPTAHKKRGNSAPFVSPYAFAYPGDMPAGVASGLSAVPLDSSSPTGSHDAVVALQLLQQKKQSPRSGWRKFVYKATMGAVNLGLSTEDKAMDELEERVRQPVHGDYRIACLSLKGGVGKTTTTIGLGSTFASLRGDRIIAIDANPDLGTLAQRVPQQTNSTVRDLLEDPDIHRYSDVRAHTSQAQSRLEVLASESDPAISEAFSERDYRRTIDILQSFYNIILTDCGTGLMHDAMRGVLDLADSLVLVSSPAIDGARSAWATLNWLDAHGYQHLVERTVVAICSSRAGSASVDMAQLRATFNQRCAAVHLIPFDEHLAEGAKVDIDHLSKGARRAFIELAASVADGFSQTLVPSSVNRREKRQSDESTTTHAPLG